MKHSNWEVAFGLSISFMLASVGIAGSSIAFHQPELARPFMLVAFLMFGIAMIGFVKSKN